MLQQVHYWLRHAKVKHEGRMWVYKTFDVWHEQDFCFWSVTTIRRTVASLRKQDLLLVEKLSNNSFNRVNHYTINYEQLRLIDTKKATKPVVVDKVNMDTSNSAEWTQHTSNMDTSDMSNMDACLREYKENTKESNSNNSDSRFSILIQEWQQPTLAAINTQLKTSSSTNLVLTDDQYRVQVTKFKNYYAEKEAQGEFIRTDNRRKDLLAEWIERDYQHQMKNKARAKPSANSKTDWSKVGTKPNDSDNDLPDVFHPSHSSPVTTSQPLFLNGLKRQPFAGMTTDESYALVDRHTQPGESRVAAYDRLLVDMQEAV